MPRYFFHVINGEFIPDHEGMECADLEDAKGRAVHVAGAMLKDIGKQLWGTRNYDMFVCDDQQKTKLKLCFTAEVLNDS